MQRRTDHVVPSSNVNIYCTTLAYSGNTMDEGAKDYKNGVNSRSVVRLVFLKTTGKLQLGYPINTQPKKTQIMTMLTDMLTSQKALSLYKEP